MKTKVISYWVTTLLIVFRVSSGGVAELVRQL